MTVRTGDAVRAPDAALEPAGALWVPRFRREALILTAVLLPLGQVLIGIVLLLVAVVSDVATGRHRPWEPTPLDRLLLGWVAVTFISALLAPYRTLALGNSVLLALGIVLGCAPLTATLRHTPRFVRPFFGAWVIGAVPAGLIVLSVYASTPAGTIARGELAQLGYNAAGTVLAASSLLAVAMFVSEREWWWPAWGLAQILILVGLATTVSRGAWGGWALGFVTFVFVTGRAVPAARRRVGIFAAIVVLAVIAGAATSPRLAAQVVQSEDPANRVLLWRDAVHMFWDHPWWGVGLGAFADAYQHSRTPNDLNERPPFAHNVFLSLAVETGVFGATAFMAVVGYALVLGVRHSFAGDAQDRLLRAGALGAFVAIMGQQMVDGTLQSFHLGFAFWLLTVVMVTAPAPSNGSGARTGAG